jgi:preprotein translocase subunit SecD
VTLQPVGDFDSASLDVVADIYRSRIDSLGVAEPEILRQGDTIVVNLPGVRDKDRAIELIGVTGKVVFRPVTNRIGPFAQPLDLSALDAATTTTAPGASTTTSPTAATSASTATTAAPAAAAGSSTSVQAAGFRQPASVASTTAAPATTVAPAAQATATTAAPTATTAAPTDTTVAGATSTTSAPLDLTTLITPNADDLPESSVVLPNRDGTEILEMGPAFALGEAAISSSTPRLLNGQWQVELTLNRGADGLDAWNEWTGKCFNRAPECATGGMAIVLDHRVISAPVPQDPFFDQPQVLISGGAGGFSEREANNLSKVLQYGSTPVEMKAQAVQTVSATLGKDSLRAGIVSGIIGILLVLAFMFFYYRALAIVVAAGIAVTGAILWSVVGLLSRTSGLALTLAGVTGIIVSVGVTVDSYVVYFERLKDEVHSGRSFRSSAQRGFKSAWRTILAADTVSLIGAGVLWYLSVGAVRGFAFFLGLSTLCDMFVAYFFTRPAVLLLSRSGRFQGKRLLGVEVEQPRELVGGAA